MVHVLDWMPKSALVATGVGLLGLGWVYWDRLSALHDESRMGIALTEEEQQIAAHAHHTTEHLTLLKRNPTRTIKLFTQEWVPKEGIEEAKGVVVLVHGMNEHSSNMLHLVQVLLEEKYAVVAFDHEGFGRSSGLHALVHNYKSLVKDLRFHLDAVRLKHPSKKVFVLGGSLGGALLLHSLLESTESVDGAIIQCPALEIHASRQPPAVVQAIGIVIAAIAPHLALMPSNGGKGSSESVRAKMQEMKLNDPLYYTGKLRLGTAFQVKQCVRDLQSKLVTNKSLPIPILLQHGNADVICSVEGSKTWFEAIEDCPDKTFKTYENTAHDLLHEPAANEIIDDLVKWLKAHC